MNRILVNFILFLTAATRLEAFQTFSRKNKRFSLFASNPNVIHNDYSKQIFCNVELNGEVVEAVGFDMDYTLAQYNEIFEKMVFEEVKMKLIKVKNYPEQIMDFPYDSVAFQRGVIIDKARGNFLKIDRHRYVRKVFHGLGKISREERHSLYSGSTYSYTESNFVNIDTMYLLIDALLFSYLVDMKDKFPSLLTKSYEAIYDDVRYCVDISHRDGTIRNAIYKDISKYIIYDNRLVPMLQRYRDNGKKVFLLTNSFWEYTNYVMNYLVHGKDNIFYEDIDWKSLFDVIFVGASKPDFLLEEYLPIFRVNVDKNNLRNIEDKYSLSYASVSPKNNVFHGGNWKDLHRLLSVDSGDRVLYVGDHMYSDILRSKRTLGWRTCLVVPELEHELEVSQRHHATGSSLLRLRQLQYDLDEYIDLMRQYQLMGTNLQKQITEGCSKAIELKRKIADIMDEYDKNFNQNWGRVFKSGFQESRFGKQVNSYACLYTSRASNLLSVSPVRLYRPNQEFMPHDQMAIDTETLSNRPIDSP